MTHALRGKSALVTGAASGIGAALVDALAARGARVVATDRTIDAFTSKAAPGVTRAALDVTDAAAFDRARIDHAPEGVDLLFNNAGIGLAGAFADTSLDDWARVLDLHVLGVARGVQAFLPQMVARGAGHIVNTASGAGLCPRPGMVAYAASKSAVVAMSLSLRAELAAAGVRVSALCPGYIATNIMAASEYRGVDPARLHAAIPIAPTSARVCAERTLRGVRRNAPIIIVDAPTRLEWMLSRISPALIGWVGALRARTFRDARIAAAPPDAV